VRITRATMKLVRARGPPVSMATINGVPSTWR
jgi:hypothetical protein